jgi:hypothetical protein
VFLPENLSLYICIVCVLSSRVLLCGELTPISRPPKALARTAACPIDLAFIALYVMNGSPTDALSFILSGKGSAGGLCACRWTLVA